MYLYFVNLDKKFFETLQKVNCPPMDLNVLVSMKKMTQSLHAMLMKLKARGIINKLALDSGTFSLQKPRCGIAPRHLFYRFLEYAKAHLDEYELIFNFDISFDPDGFDKNQEILKFLSDAGVKVIPVAHDLVNADYQLLADLGHKSIAFGQDRARSVKSLLKANIDLMGQGVRIRHGLGIFDPSVLLFVPFTSVDATTAVKAAAKYDIYYIPTTPNSRGIWKKLNVASGNIDSDSKSELIRWIDELGINITLNDITGNEGREYRKILNVLFYLEMKKVIDKYNKAVIHYLNTGEVLQQSMIH